jgi:hypothetical protein
MKAGIGFCRRPLMGALAVGLLVIGTSAFGQEIRMFPLRSAPIGSPAGTIGAPVLPTFTGGAWDVAFPAGGIEVDIDVQGGGWGNSAAGVVGLGAIQATIDSSGFSNGVGCDISPKGWPATPAIGAYQTFKVCGAGGDGSPASPPFDTLCTGNGFAVDNPDFIFRPYMNTNHLSAVAFPTLDYGYASAAQNTDNTFDPDPSAFGTFGGLIMEVPSCAAGTYIVGPIPDPNLTFMTAANSAPIDGVMVVPASITITTGKCCSAIGPGVTCEDNLTTGQCDQRPLPRLFVPGETCDGPTVQDDCPSCNFETQTGCDDGTLCTDDYCNPDGTCTYTDNYDTFVDCCDPTTGDTTHRRW